jgi:6-phosphogluconolactonase
MRPVELDRHDCNDRELSRRALLVAGLLATGACAGAGSGAAGRPAARALAAGVERAARTRTVYVGTYSLPSGGRGIYRTSLDLDTGALAPPSLAAEAVNASFLAVHPNGRFLYAVSEVGDFEGAPSGAVVAYAIDAATRDLRRLNAVPSGGAAPCYIAVAPGGRHVVVANYGGGSVAAFPIGEGGALAPASGFVQHTGGSNVHPRQKAPHAHIALPAPDGNLIYVADLGLDEVRIYRLDPGTGGLAPGEPASASLPPGSGPRHVAFHPSGRFAYVNNELTSSVTTFARDPATGALAQVETLSTLPEPRPPSNSTAQILVTPDGRHVFVSNRGHDSVAGFAIDEGSGRLRPNGHTPTRGKTPRNFNIDPEGRFLLVANQGSRGPAPAPGTDGLVAFRLDPATGRLEAVGAPLPIPRPVCVAFAAG